MHAINSLNTWFLQNTERKSRDEILLTNRCRDLVDSSMRRHLPVLLVTFSLERVSAALLPRAIEIATVLPEPFAKFALGLFFSAGAGIYVFLVFFGDTG
jgi:hypothetical protein